jgi:hypothetical protein
MNTFLKKIFGSGKARLVGRGRKRLNNPRYGISENGSKEKPKIENEMKRVHLVHMSISEL